MKRLCVTVVVVALAAWSVGALAAQNAPAGASTAQSGAAAPENQIKGAIPVKLAKNLDSKKLKVGDTVVFETISTVHSRSGLMIPSGSKVIGHVTQAQARSKGDASSTLAFAFDKIEYAQGKQVPMKGTLQAVGPNLGGAEGSAGSISPYGNVLSSNNAGSAGNQPPPTSSMQVGGPTNGMPLLISTSQGVLGVKGLQMDSNGVLTSPGKEVRLDAGAQILIRAEIDLP